MLSVRQLNHFYGASHTLWDLDFSVQAGTCTCILGRNGVGKTTFMDCLMGLLPIKSGEVVFDGNKLHKLAAEKRAALGIGYVPQGRQIFPLLSVHENLLCGLSSRKKSKANIPSFVFDLFPVLWDMKNRRGGDLSGGQQQQLAIARALVIEPKLLILDEPAEGIQPTIVAEIGETILQLNKEAGITVLLVEQKLPFARRVASHFLVLDRGRSVAKGTIAELSDDLVNQYLTV